MFYYAVFYKLFGKTMELIILAFGPFPIQLCYFRKFVRGVISLQLMQLQTAVVTVKYFYIFVIKNPSGTKEEF